MPSEKIAIMLVILKMNPEGICIFFINTDKMMPQRSENSNFHLVASKTSVSPAAGVAKWQTHRT
jgi:hypothetical protein